MRYTVSCLRWIVNDSFDNNSYYEQIVSQLPNFEVKVV